MKTVTKTTVTKDTTSRIGLKTGSTSVKNVHETKTTERTGQKFDTSISRDINERNVQKSTVINKLVKVKTGERNSQCT